MAYQLCFANKTFGDTQSRRAQPEHPKLQFWLITFPGAGDLLAALLLAWLHRTPDDLQLAVERAVSALQAVLKYTAKAAGGAATAQERIAEVCRARELRLIECQQCLIDPAVNLSAKPL